MARIVTYDKDAAIMARDKLLGTDAVDDSTKNFTIQDLAKYFASTGMAEPNGTTLFWQAFGPDHSKSGYYVITPHSDYSGLTEIRVSNTALYGTSPLKLLEEYIESVVKINNTDALSYGLYLLSEIQTYGEELILKLTYISGEEGFIAAESGDVLSLAPVKSPGGGGGGGSDEVDTWALKVNPNEAIPSSKVQEIARQEGGSTTDGNKFWTGLKAQYNDLLFADMVFDDTTYIVLDETPGSGGVTPSVASIIGTLDEIDVTEIGDISQVGLDSAITDAIDDNTAKTGITIEQTDAIIMNTAKTGITPAQALAIINNSAKAGLSPEQVEAINANTAKNSYPSQDANKLAGIETNANVTDTQNVVASLTAGENITISGTGVISALHQGTVSVIGTPNEIDVTTGSNGTSQVALDDTVTNTIANTAAAVLTEEARVDVNVREIASNRASINTNSDNIEVNTAKKGVSQEQADEIIANTAKVGITPSQTAQIEINRLKVGITSSQASQIETNTLKVGITSTQSTAIENNTAKNSYPVDDANKLATIATNADVTLDSISAGANITISPSGVIAGTGGGGTSTIVSTFPITSSTSDDITTVGFESSVLSEIGANTNKTGITPEQTAAINTNTTKTGITSSQATAITTNTSGVSTNVTNITTNTTDIATNVANITTNTTDISTNTAAIAGLGGGGQPKFYGFRIEANQDLILETLLSTENDAVNASSYADWVNQPDGITYALVGDDLIQTI